jgi:predicted ATPase
LRQYERLREVLRRELGAEPGPATRRLRDDVAAGRTPPTQPPPEDLLPSRETPVERRNNLPAPLSSFVGREREMTGVKRELAMTRLLTLTGAGGCGKTRLALEVAREVAGAYPDGAWLVELAGLPEGYLVLGELASALGLREEPGRPLVETFAGAPRSKRMLLVLDSCEHLIETCTRLAETLLASCPGLRILATSREPLGIVGETNRVVPPLSVPDPRRRSTLEELMAYESVRLFVDRAGRRNPAFVPTPENAEAVAEICLKLDGIPLAIELAASRVGLSPDQIAARLADPLELLTTGGRTAAPRQRTMRATLEWSYDLLT